MPAQKKHSDNPPAVSPVAGRFDHFKAEPEGLLDILRLTPKEIVGIPSEGRTVLDYYEAKARLLLSKYPDLPEDVRAEVLKLLLRPENITRAVEGGLAELVIEIVQSAKPDKSHLAEDETAPESYTDEQGDIVYIVRPVDIIFDSSDVPNWDEDLGVE